jgi:hypothetical protein
VKKRTETHVDEFVSQGSSPPCRTCGCQGHGQPYTVTCSVCRKPKYPILLTKPDPITYVCTLCRIGSAERRQARRVGGVARGRQRSSQKLPGASA